MDKSVYKKVNVRNIKINNPVKIRIYMENIVYGKLLMNHKNVKISKNVKNSH